MKSSPKITFLRLALAPIALGVALMMSSPTSSEASGLTAFKVENGARSSALGEAFVAVAGDPLSQYYNPAGAIAEHDFLAYFGHTSYWQNVTFESGFFAVRKGKLSYTFSARLAQTDNIEAREAVASVQPLYLFESRDISLKFGVAYPLSPEWKVGVAAGWLAEKIDSYQGSTFVIDLGTQYQHSRRLSFGASLSNLGGAIVLLSEEISAPTTLRLGSSFWQGNFQLLTDIVHVDDELHAHLGLEYAGVKDLAFRAGYQSGYDSKNVTFGVGFTRREIRIDYAFVPYANGLGESHQFGLSVFLP